MMDTGEVAHASHGTPLSRKKKEILAPAPTWMGLEGAVLSGVSQTETNARQCHLRVESRQQNKHTHKIETNSGTEDVLTVARWRGGCLGRDAAAAALPSQGEGQHGGHSVL